MTGSSVPSSPLVWAEHPRARSAREAELVRLRLPDRPGSLAAVASHLADHGVDVLRLEVVDRGSGGAVDDLLLAGSGLEPALASLGSRALVLGRRAGVELGDPGLEMAAACEAVASARTAPAAYGQLVRAALGLVFAEAGLVFADREPGLLAVVASSVPGIPVAVESEGNSLVASALFSRQNLTADGRIPWAPATVRERLPGGSVAVVPGGGLALALVREDHAPFVVVELDRLSALLRVAVRSIP
jgi:ACT domain